LIVGKQFMPEIEDRRLCSGSRLDFRLIWRCCRSAPTRFLWWHQATSEQVQIRQRKGGEQAGGVLGQSAVTNFGKTPQMLDDSKGVLTASPGLGADLIDVALIIRERPRLGAATVDPIADPPGQRRREYPDFCVLSHTLPKEREYGDQERDFGRVAEG
jgi:hypothetical protein